MRFLRFPLGMSLVGVLLTSSSCQRSIEPDFQLRLGEIIKPIQLKNETLVGSAFPKTLEKLRQGILKDNSGSDSLGPFMVNSEGQRRDIVTLEDYRQAKKEGYYAPSTFDMAVESWATQADAIELFLRSSCLRSMQTPASFQPDELLVSFLFSIGSDQQQQMDEDIARGMTVRDYRIAGMHHPNPAEVESVEEGRGLIYDYTQKGPHSWVFKHQSYLYCLEVLARGDINCDGHRDILLGLGLYNLHGTGRSDWYHVVLGGGSPPYEAIHLRDVLALEKH